MKKHDGLVIGLLFATASLNVVAAADIMPPFQRLLAAALASGCGAVLAVLRPVGSTTRDERVQAVRDAGRDREGRG